MEERGGEDDGNSPKRERMLTNLIFITLQSSEGTVQGLEYAS